MKISCTAKIKNRSQNCTNKILSVFTIQNAPTASAIFSPNLGIDSSAICIMLCKRIRDNINDELIQKQEYTNLRLH